MPLRLKGWTKVRSADMQLQRVVEVRELFEQATATPDIRVRLRYLADAVDLLQEIRSEGAREEVAAANHIAEVHVRRFLREMPLQGLDQSTWANYLIAVRYACVSNADHIIAHETEARQRLMRYCRMHPVDLDELVQLHQKWTGHSSRPREDQPSE